MPFFHIDDGDRTALRDVAHILHIINPHARSYSAEGLVDYMIGFAERNLADGKATYGGTLGFYLAVWQDHEGRWRILPTVSPSTVLRHLRGG